jgi:hypothetical protein
MTAALTDYPGFLTRGRTWEAAQEKFERLAGPRASTALREQIVSAVFRLERLRVTELTSLLALVEPARAAGRRRTDAIAVASAPEANATDADSRNGTAA